MSKKRKSESVELQGLVIALKAGIVVTDAVFESEVGDDGHREPVLVRQYYAAPDLAERIAGIPKRGR
ncbi:MAG: hypothetical protein M0Z67_04190 [Nitrospiraceae bacterium]|nr:hypothetical protein [Nitrospiraceae bacterium]